MVVTSSRSASSSSFFSLYLSVPLFFCGRNEFFFQLYSLKNTWYLPRISCEWSVLREGFHRSAENNMCLFHAREFLLHRIRLLSRLECGAFLSSEKFPHTYIHRKLPTVEIHPLGHSNDCVSYNKWDKNENAKERRGRMENYKMNSRHTIIFKAISSSRTLSERNV